MIFFFDRIYKITPEEFKKSQCKSQKEKIKRIWNSLKNIDYKPPTELLQKLPSAPALYSNTVNVGGNN